MGIVNFDLVISYKFYLVFLNCNFGEENDSRSTTNEGKRHRESKREKEKAFDHHHHKNNYEIN